MRPLRGRSLKRALQLSASVSHATAPPRLLMKLAIALALLLPPTMATPTPSQGIRGVDFRNRTYLLDGQMTHLRGGKAVVPDAEDPLTMSRTVKLQALAFGDLDSDTEEEAAVVLGYRGGGTGYFTSGYLYGLRNGRLVLLTTFKGGDRAEGGIDEIRIEKGALIVFRDFGQAACCTEYRIATWYRWSGTRLRVVRSERQEIEK